MGRAVGAGRKSRAFTLLEMMVVVFCLAMLAAVVLGAYESVSDETGRFVCATKLKRLSGLFAAYAEAYGGFLPDTGAASRLGGTLSRHSWHFSDTWDSRGTNLWPAERTTGNAGNLYLLVRLQLAAPADFICPACGDKPAFGDLGAGRTGFLEFEPGSALLSDREQRFQQLNATRHCSYSYQNMFGYPEQNPALADPRAASVHVDASPPDLVILADHNPYTQLRNERRFCRDPQTEPLANSLNHGGRGQNVLYLDGSVSWETSPYCGALLPDGTRDNIYRPASGSITDPLNIPRHTRDSYLVP